MGRTVGELSAPGGGPIAEALGEYLLDFAEVEAALSLLFAFLKSMDPQDPSRWDDDAWKDAEGEIGKLTAGQLAGKVNKLVLKALNAESEAELRARDIWCDLAERGCPVIADRNLLVHRQLMNVEEVIDSAQTGLVLRSGDLLTESGLRVRANAVRRLATDLRKFYGTFVQAKVQSKVAP